VFVLSGDSRRQPAGTMRGMKHSLALASIFVGTATLVGCGSDPADIAGEYSANLTSRDNGCSLANWQEGGTASQIPVTITQEGDSASADVGGLARVDWNGGDPWRSV
jgi:hypothetical protein